MKNEDKTTTAAKPEEGVACGLVQRLVLWLERCRKIRFLKSNGWLTVSEHWIPGGVSSPKRLYTLDEAFEYELALHATT